MIRFGPVLAMPWRRRVVAAAACALGGALTAVAQDFTRSTLAEAGMNYSLLLDRSVDFDDYLTILKPSYPSRFDRLIGLDGLIEWWTASRWADHDRGADGRQREQAGGDQ